MGYFRLASGAPVGSGDIGYLGRLRGSIRAICQVPGRGHMSDWLHNLPLVWMALIVFGATYLLSAVLYAAVALLAVGKRAHSFKAVSPGMLPPLGIVFGLFVGFTAAQVWSSGDQAATAVDREAHALRSAVILAAAFPGEPETRLRGLVRDYIATAAREEWPMMSHRMLTAQVAPTSLVQALQYTLSLTPSSPGQQTAQRDLATALESALDARLQRIGISLSQVNLVKWSCLYLQAACALLAIAMVHSDNRLTGAIAMGLFATGIAAAVLLIVSHDRPFIGEVSVGPGPLLQVAPAAEAGERVAAPETAPK